MSTTSDPTAAVPLADISPTETSSTEPPATALEQRVGRIARRIADDRSARLAFGCAVLAAILVYYVVGRHQWFTRDDWAAVITRDRVREQLGWQHWLFVAQDGHWLAVPYLIFGVTRGVFGLDSYWPFLIPALAADVGAVFLVRTMCRRHGVSAWTTTLVCSLLLVFGSGWENLVFAIQICYNLSLFVFLAQLVLVDHDGPVDRRDVLGAGLAVIGMMSSGFGPIFMVGMFVFLALRQRWRALLVAVVPQAAAYGWWLLRWSKDPVADQNPGNRSLLPTFVVRGISSTFEAMTSLPGLAGIAIVGTIVVAMHSNPRRTQALTITLLTTVLVMFTAIGFQRLGFGLAIASSSRYQHMAAIVVAPAFALMIDRLSRFGRDVRRAGLIVVVIAIGSNFATLRQYTVDWAIASRNEKETLELIAGSGLAPSADQKRFPFVNSPDVTVGSVQWLVDNGAVTPRTPANDAELQRVKVALGLIPPPP